MRERGMEDEVQRFLGKYKNRFCNLSLFVKELKERFSRWFNKKHERKGTLWMDRFKSVLVEDGNALRTMATYIDLNSVRAGIIEDPKDYRWCGYAEAVAGSKRARRGLCQVVGVPQDGGWVNQMVRNVAGESVESLGGGARYRCWLLSDGGDYGGGLREFLEDEGDSEREVQVPRVHLLSKMRHLTEGLVVGSSHFVGLYYQKYRESFSPRRKQGARPLSPLSPQSSSQSLSLLCSLKR